MPLPSDTIAALATPVGTSAIALLRVSGPLAGTLAGDLANETLTPRVAHHMVYRGLAGQLVDDVLLTFFKAPHSYTGEDSLEISCHGNPLIAQLILQDLLQRGCRVAEAGEFTKRAFLSGKLDLSQAEAVMDLIHARSERALAVANEQLRGALGRAMDTLIGLLVSSLASVEAYIDFPDEDLPPENRTALKESIQRLLTETQKLLATQPYGELLRSGIKTVIIGETNAGKSSIMNRLLGFERALVSAEPGTTRDYLEEPVRLGTHSLRLIDTAGLNPEALGLERRGIDKTREQLARADLTLWVVDSTAPRWHLPADFSGRVAANNTIVLLNKTDVAQAAPSPAVQGYTVLPVSAATGAGFAELTESIGRFADRFRVDIGEESIVINARHADSLQRALDALAAASTKLDGDVSTELLASDLRQALDAFGEISGKVDNERMLDALFSSFCIGK